MLFRSTFFRFVSRVLARIVVLHSWIKRCLKLFKISGKVLNLLEYAMSQWRVELTPGGERLADVQIKGGIFQGDSLSPILFVLALIPLSIILNKAKEGYSLGKDRAKLNHLLFMDDLKLYGKDKDQLDSLVQTVRTFISDIEMTFGIKKCAMVEMKRGKLIDSDGLDLPEGEKIRSLQDEEAYKYIGVLVGAVSAQKYLNCANCDTSMKLGRNRQFDTLKGIGCGHKLKNAPLCYL